MEKAMILFSVLLLGWTWTLLGVPVDGDHVEPSVAPAEVEDPTVNATLLNTTLLNPRTTFLFNATEICEQAPETGPCDAYIPRYFYNSSSMSCQLFTYGGVLKSSSTVSLTVIVRPEEDRFANVISAHLTRTYLRLSSDGRCHLTRNTLTWEDSKMERVEILLGLHVCIRHHPAEDPHDNGNHSGPHGCTEKGSSEVDGLKALQSEGGNEDKETREKAEENRSGVRRESFLHVFHKLLQVSGVRRISDGCHSSFSLGSCTRRKGHNSAICGILKRFMNSTHMDWRRPLPIAMRTRCCFSMSRTGWFIRYRQISPMYCTIWRRVEQDGNASPIANATHPPPPSSLLLPSLSSEPNITALALEMVTQWTKASSLKLKLIRAASTPILAMPSQRPTYWDLFSMKRATTPYLKTPFQQHVGYSVGVLIQLMEGPPLPSPLKDKCCFVAVAAHGFSKDLGNGVLFSELNKTQGYRDLESESEILMQSKLSMVTAESSIEQHVLTLVFSAT
ncbi:hypothetical protein FQN60_007990 [Etheostoma spectabile]|uniref:BPTI/Kunitz inhibitor domain-containing protein n=1 Tax=Etheostoma spectabile TaxID=54343 RepID=A0A5J5CV91_9PERO|nr:hypothetical protein FQN60_007990 [Etheostoma spectabile]